MQARGIVCGEGWVGLPVIVLGWGLEVLTCNDPYRGKKLLQSPVRGGSDGLLPPVTYWINGLMLRALLVHRASQMCCMEGREVPISVIVLKSSSASIRCIYNIYTMRFSLYICVFGSHSRTIQWTLLIRNTIWMLSSGFSQHDEFMTCHLLHTSQLIHVLKDERHFEVL